MTRSTSLQHQLNSSTYQPTSSLQQHQFPLQRKNDLMENPNDAGLIFYPAYCFKASPTHFAWVKMALADVHRLQRRKGFEGEFYFFHLVDARSLSVQNIILSPFRMTEWTRLHSSFPPYFLDQSQDDISTPYPIHQIQKRNRQNSSTH